MAKRINWALKLKKRIDNSPLTISVVILVFFISSAFTILQGIAWAYKNYNEYFNWRNAEYKKISSMKAGMFIEKFNETFGVPIFTRVSINNYKEYTFQNRDYWVQAIASSSGEVVFYSITSCDNEFKPTLEDNPIRAEIKLQESTFDSVSRSAGNSLPNLSIYYFRVATANSQFLDSYSYGNPSQYKTVFVGINDACSEPKVFIDGNKLVYTEKDFNNPQVNNFRKMAIINSYGETSPMFDPHEVINSSFQLYPYPLDGNEKEHSLFQFGVDRIQIRTLQ